MAKRLRLALICFFLTSLQAQAQPFTSVSFSIQAHQDDWQLFMSSRVIADMYVAQRKMVFITLTAGDESCGACTYYGTGPFFMGRETGSVYASMFAADLTLGTTTTDIPTATTVAMNGHNITKYTYKNTVNYFLRLPDGNTNGSGFQNNNYQSLNKLRTGAIASISTIGINDVPPLTPTATYTGWTDLTNTIKAIINAEKISGTQSWIHTAHDNTSTYNINDHSDHTNASLAAQAAVSSGMTWVGVNGFMDYQSSAYSSPLLSDVDHQNASIAFGMEALGMAEFQYQNDYNSSHMQWLPIDLFQVIRNPSGNAPFAAGTGGTPDPGFNAGYTEIPMVISVSSPATANKDISMGISPYEPGELITSIYDMTGNKVYELSTRILNRDAFALVLKAPIKSKGIYLIKNILNNQFIETRKLVVND